MNLGQLSSSLKIITMNPVDIAYNNQRAIFRVILERRYA